MKTLGLILVLALTGCASNKYWYKEGTTTEQSRHDLLECRYEAEKYSTGAGAGYETGVGSGVAIGLKQRKLIIECMELKGYRLISTNEMPPGTHINRIR